MPFIPHTEDDVREMLATIGINNMDALFSEIPTALKHAPLEHIPEGISEMALSRLAHERAMQDGQLLCFIGAGAYEHHIPAAVWQIATRGEFMTAYTPYQAEASQGSLQLIYEYQSMMAHLLAMDVSNASLYDGASALAEAVLMAVRLNHKNNRRCILMPRTVHPLYRETVRTIVHQQHIELIDVPYLQSTGEIDQAALQKVATDHVAALVIPQPNFFGVLEDVDALTRWSQQKQILSIAVVNPLTMSLLKPPGQWGDQGVDIACGEGQPLGVPLAGGGPYYGFICAKVAHVRQMPGRIVGRTVDQNGKEGFVLTLQAREQHIRRAKATSNICTNQGLMVTASTIYMSLLGPEGLKRIAALCHERTRELCETLLAIPGISQLFNAPYFHEIAIRLNQSTAPILAELAKRGIQAGIDLSAYYPELENCLLLCATETKTSADIQLLANSLRDAVNGRKMACPA